MAGHLIMRSTSRWRRQFSEPRIDRAVLGHLGDYAEIYSIARNRLANESRHRQMVTP